MDEYDKLKEYLLHKGFDKFNAKQLRLDLPSFHKYALKTLRSYLKRMHNEGILERGSVSTNCKTLCSSCYEYGCDAKQSPPINFWKVSEDFRNEEAIKLRAKM